MDFSDGTTYSSASPDLFSEPTLVVPARPVAVRMSFLNYQLRRHIALSLHHGDSTYENQVLVSANEPDWLNQNFLAIKDLLEAVRPQANWVKKYRTVLLHLLAISLGISLYAAIEFLMDSITRGIDFSTVVRPLPSDSPWRLIVAQARPFFFLIGWFWYWLMGITWAFPIRAWFMSVWPSVEFDFGLPHLKTERIKRQRLAAVVTLVAIPIACNIVYDIMKKI